MPLFAETSLLETNLLAARLQMALTLGFHIILACLGVGLPVLLLIVEGLWIRTGDPLWRELARRWSRAFAVLFAVGAVSGTVLSFELGMLWPGFMGTFGSVIGLPFTLEAFAFFLEAIFVGIYLYGWNRLDPYIHWLCGIPIALSGAASAWFVTTANAWMNSPAGFEMIEGRVENVDPIAAMLNASTPMQTTHMLVAAYMVAGFSVASYYAVRRLWGDRTEYNRRGLLLGLALGVFFTPVQMVVGDWAAKVVAKNQPVKLAAMEGQFTTEQGAPLRIGGLPDESARTTRYALEIPRMLSFLAHGSFEAEVLGLEEFPEEDWPPVAIVHIAFQIMVGCGTLLLVLALLCCVYWIRRRPLPEAQWFLLFTALGGPLAILALEAGWVVTEVGRQPWIVQGVMRTREAATAAPGVVTVFVATLAIYAAIGLAAAVVLRMLARKPRQVE